MRVYACGSHVSHLCRFEGLCVILCTISISEHYTVQALNCALIHRSTSTDIPRLPLLRLFQCLQSTHQSIQVILVHFLNKDHLRHQRYPFTGQAFQEVHRQMSYAAQSPTSHGYEDDSCCGILRNHSYYRSI